MVPPCQPNQAMCTTGSKFRQNTQELAWSRCARVRRRSRLIFLEVMENVPMNLAETVLPLGSFAEMPALERYAEMPVLVF